MTDESFSGSGEELQTEWSSNKATLIRIDESLRRAANASLRRDYVDWFKYLEILKREAIVKMKHKKDKEGVCTDECERCNCVKLFKKLETNINTYKRAYTKVGFDNLCSQLDVTEIFLRDFMDKKGLLMRDNKDGLSMFMGK